MTETVVTARRERGRKEGSSDLVQSSGDIVYLASDASSCKMKLYLILLQQDLTTATKTTRAMCFDANVFNLLTFTEEVVREISVKDMRFFERKLREKKILLKWLKTNLYIISLTWSVRHVESVGHRRTRECVAGDQEQTNTTLTRSRDVLREV